MLYPLRPAPTFGRPAHAAVMKKYRFAWGDYKMDVLEAIHTRRTTKTFRPDPVPRDLIEQVLEAAVWAPNHRLTEPWEFVVVQGEALERLALSRRQMTVDFLANRELPEGARRPAPEQIAAQAEESYRKGLAAPVSIFVSVAQHANPAIREEDYAAAAAAIQNLMLAAHGLGLAGYWSTGAIISYPPALELLGIPPERRVIGAIQLGYSAEQRTQKRTPAAARTHWLGEAAVVSGAA